MPNRRIVRAVVLACTVVICQCAAPVFAEFMLPTDLSPGQQYQLIFFTDGTGDAMSDSIAYYNTFVTAEAASHPELPTASWYAIMSIYSGPDARDNAQPYVGVPVYNTRGERVSDGAAALVAPTERTDLFDTQNDNHDAAIYDIDGNRLGVAYVATGSWWTGRKQYAAGAPPYYYYGWPFADNPITVGLPDRLDDGWIDCGMADGNYAVWTDYHFYGLSSVLTVPVPEPSTFVLLAIAAIGLFGWRRRRQAA